MVDRSAAAMSPCVRNCCLNEKDICLGCFRHLEEIKQWSVFSESERVMVLKKTELRKKEYNEKISKYW